MSVRRGRVALAAAALVAAGGVCRAQDAAPTTPPPPPPNAAPDLDALLAEAPPAYTADEARAWRDAVLPVVERVAGKRLTAVPDVRIVTRDELIEAAAAEMASVRQALGGRSDAAAAAGDGADLMKELGDFELMLEATALAPALLGRFDHDAHVIQLPAGNLAPLLERTGATMERRDGVMKLVIAHELAHALHDEHVGLRKGLDAVRTPGSHRALLATREGFGMLVQARVAADRGLEPALDDLLDAMGVKGVGAPATAAQKRYREIYGAGWEFLRFHAAAGGMERVWSILARPPLVYAQIREPATYGDPVEMRIDVDRLFAGFGLDIFPGAWPARQTIALDTEDVVRTYEPLGPQVAETIRAGVKEAHTLILMQQGTAPTVRSVTTFVLTDLTHGPAVLSLVTALKEHQFAQARQRVAALGALELTEPAEVVPGFDLETARLYRLSMRSADERIPISIDLGVAVAVRGDVAVQVVTSGGAIDTAEIARAMTTAIARLDEGTATVPVEPPDTSDPLVQALAVLDDALGGGAWEGESQEVTKALAAAIVGQDVGAAVAIELAFVRGQTTYRERSGAGAARHAVNVLLLEMTDAKSAALVAGPVFTTMSGRLEQMAAMPGTTLERGEVETRTIGEGETAITVTRQRATMTLPNQAPGDITLISAAIGRHVIHMMDVGGGLGTEGVTRVITTLADRLR